MTPFRDRLKEAAKHAGVEYSQTAIAKSLEVSKQTVDQWMANGRPTPETIFRIADKWRLNPRWLAIGDGEMSSKTLRQQVAVYSVTEGELSPKEEILLQLYRGLFSHQQLELIGELRALFQANQIVRKELGQKTLRGVSNQAVEDAFGKVPPTPRPVKKLASKPRRPGTEEDPE